MNGRNIAYSRVLIALAFLFAADGSLRPPARDLVSPLLEQVPHAAEVLAFSGGGFLPGSVPLGQSDTAAAAEQSGARALDVRIPTVTSSAFLVGSSGGRARVAVTLGGARAASLEVEAGRGVYRSVYAGVDVVAVRDPAYFELAFVVREPARAPELALQIGTPESGEHVSIETGSGAAVVRSKTGAPLLRVEPPVAFDAAGVRREGHYEWTGSQLAIALNVSDLTPPVVVDPRFAIPFWTMLSDVRAPGATSYHAASGSREIRLAFDEARGKAVLIRPVRSQQREDATASFGKLAFEQRMYGALSPQLRVAPDGSVTAGAREREDWTRSYYAESETWEWNGASWAALPLTGLGGLIDPALSFDRGRQRLVVTSGAFPDVNCRNQAFYTNVVTNTTRCSLGQLDSTYELGAGGWSQRSIAASPPPRVRAAFAPFPPHLVLFGGRALEPPPGNPVVNQYGRPYPDNMAAGLLNDTWRYDGERWERVPTANPPPGRENAPLVFDERRKRLVLLGGTEAGFDIWEFDGTDWVERVSAEDAALPVSLNGRKKMLAAWNPARQATLLFGGLARKLESCTLDEVTIAVQRRDPRNLEALNAAGCLGGYVHDSWEWDGQALRQLTHTAYSGTVRGIPLFRQIQDGASWFAPAAPPEVAGPGAGSSPLLPWRYDADPAHFRLRSTLERAHGPSDLAPARAQLPAAPAVPVTRPPAAAPSFASPLFASEAQPDMVLDPTRGKALFVSPEDGRVFETNGAVWSERTPTATPFATGARDFFGATWDSAGQRIVLFDPRTAQTWSHSDTGGWARLTPTQSPPAWSVDPEVRRERDVSTDKADGSDAYRFADAAKRAPRMVFDRARSRTVMLYSGALWELEGDAWLRRPAAPGWDTCDSATLLAYDGLRSRVVALGCKLPGQTMEWDGSSWHGPLPGPYTELIQRQLSQAGGAVIYGVWKGTLQMSWAHPNALFESPLLGGVSTFDGTGKLLTWNGTSWRAGPRLEEGPDCDWTLEVHRDRAAGMPINNLHHFTGRDYVPLCFFPPGIEDSANNRLLVFRDGAAGLRELRLGVPAPAWAPAKLGDAFGEGIRNLRWTRAHPHPLELASAEHVTLRTQTDPASIQLFEYVTKPNGSRLLEADARALVLPRDSARVPESLANNLFWPFRIFPDPVTKRIRVLTHRGVVWELGAELRTGPGDACTSSADCGEGVCSSEGVCCDSVCGSACYTCKANHPGSCEPVAAGAPDPMARCGSGACEGMCSGDSSARCVFEASRSCGAEPSCSDGAITPGAHCAANAPSCVSSGPTKIPCAGGFACADAASCKTSCTTRADCTNPYAACNVATGSCQPDAVSARASARGVQPSDWAPPARRSPAEMADALRGLGFESDGQGRILFSDFSMAGVTLAFDPTLQTPLTGFRSCMDRITACRVQRGTLDECVAAAPRCVSDAPWADDPAGFDCCPVECLSQYFELRESETPGRAMISLAESMCYPGMQSYLESAR